MKFRNEKILELSVLFLIILFGIYLSLISGYGSDEDTLPMIGAFESMMSGQKVMASRFTPYPVAEIGIGFLSYQLGSWAANLLTFIFIIIGCSFFYVSLCKKYELNDLILFLIICLSSPILFFDNIEPIDYSWAFVFLAIGTFFLKKKYFELAVVFFGISIGTRINFILFVFFIIFFFQYSPQIKKPRKILIFLASFFIGGLFYLTIWFQHGFGIEWLTAVTPNNQGLIGLLSRFFYKTFMSITLLSTAFISIVFYLFLKKNKIKKFLDFENSKLIFGIIISNLMLFFFIPAEMSYLQPFLISLYYFIYKLFNKKIVYFLIVLNFFSWFVDFDFLEIQYKTKDKCNNVEAISANLQFHLNQGRLFEFLGSRDKISCWIQDDSERSKKILSGKALKE
ncbi:hypothetical protein N8212_00790 [Pelagibacteraceae bacterium]|nr:hypothetical protein [Pelagibacteraceae bacterium]